MSTQPSPQPLLQVTDLTAGYRGWQVLRNVSLSIHPGETIGILGHNGAGKTTLLRCIAGLISATGGQIHYRGSDITRSSVPSRVRQGIVLVPQGRALFPDMSVEENVVLGAFRRTKAEAEAAWKSLSTDEPFLKARRTEVVSRLSGGQQQIVANSRGLASGPSVLMVDEPSLGLSGLAVSALLEFLAKLKAKGMTTVLVEQNVGLAMRACDRFAVIKGGEMIGVYEKSAFPAKDLWALF